MGLDILMRNGSVHDDAGRGPVIAAIQDRRTPPDLCAPAVAPHRYAIGLVRSGPSTMVGSLRAAAQGRTGEMTYVGVRRTGIVVVLREMTTARPRAEVERLRGSLARELNDDDLSASVAPADGGAVAANGALLQAEQMLLLRRSDVGRGRTTTLDDLGPYRFIVGRPTDEIRAFCEEELAPLAPPRSARDAELLVTLEAYLGCDRSPLHVGKQLFLHRNTVHDRIRQIRGLLGGRLDDAESRLALQLALLGWRALSKLDPQPLDPGKTQHERVAASPGTVVLHSTSRAAFWDPRVGGPRLPGTEHISRAI